VGYCVLVLAGAYFAAGLAVNELGLSGFQRQVRPCDLNCGRAFHRPDGPGDYHPGMDVVLLSE
jgi:hypothetical protein